MVCPAVTMGVGNRYIDLPPPLGQKLWRAYQPRLSRSSGEPLPTLETRSLKDLRKLGRQAAVFPGGGSNPLPRGIFAVTIGTEVPWDYCDSRSRKVISSYETS